MAKLNKMTIEQVAAQAGVSIATVSRVLNLKDNVNPETRKKVLEAMDALNYHPGIFNDNPQGSLIVMLVPRISNPFYNSIIDGAEAAASRRGYHLLLSQTYNSNNILSDFELILKDKSVAGMLLLNYMSDAELLEKLSLLCPIVQCSEFCENSDVSYVSIDDFAAAKNVTDYLLSIGRQKIALVNSSLNFKYARQRETGFVTSMNNAGKEVNPNWILHLPDINFDLALSNAMLLLNNMERPDAFFAISDVYAAAIIKAATRLGLNVPKDISVVGFDNTEISIMTEPSITTVNQPRFQLGSFACDLLIDKIIDPTLPNKHMILDTELIVRDSTLF
jgi:DNA-binding LacI/PurR family transcriptional regulator